MEEYGHWQKKYYKYKLKYQNLLKESGVLENEPDPDVDGPDNVQIDPNNLHVRDPDSEFPDSPSVPEEMSDPGALSDADETPKGEIIGFDDQQYDDKSKSDEKDIGLLGDARGELRRMSDFRNEEFVRPKNRPNSDKILFIKTENDFDIFTDKYGYIVDDNLLIKWDLISDLYKGFYLSPGVLVNRYDMVPYLGETYESWVNNYRYFDYPLLRITSRVNGDKKRQRESMVMIFDKNEPTQTEITEYEGKRITKPFKGKVIDPFHISEKRLTNRIGKNIREQSRMNTKNKILFIDNIQTFDIFTNRYGEVKSVKKTPYVTIDWDLVSADYSGFYINKDNMFKDVRYDYVFYDSVKYPSWWKYYKISDQVVYFFD